MKHPFSGKILFIYLIIWAAIMAAYISLLSLAFDFDIQVALIDGLLHNIPLVGLGLGFWYIVQYVSPKNGGLISLVINLSLSTLVAVAMVNYGSHIILSEVLESELVYQAFLYDALPWRIFIGVLILAVIIMIYYLLKYNQNLQQKEADELELQSLLKQSELDMLKFQINPHFIFNSLNSISALTITAPEKAQEMVIKLSDFLRSSLGRDNSELLKVSEELERMELYLDIEKVRFGDRIKVSKAIEDKCLTMTLPNMMLQPLYENAIKYGIYEQVDGVSIRIECRCDSGNLNISITNSYDCRAVPQKGKGIGLKNVRNRLELIYGIPDLVTIEKDKECFAVRLLIPQDMPNTNSYL